MGVRYVCKASDCGLEFFWRIDNEKSFMLQECPACQKAWNFGSGDARRALLVELRNLLKQQSKSKDETVSVRLVMAYEEESL